MTNYKILINSKGVPVLVEVPKHPSTKDDWGLCRYEVSQTLLDQYDQALSTALADESKHIAFKDEFEVWKILDKANYFDGLPMAERKGQTFDLPENIGVSFEHQVKSSLWGETPPWISYSENYWNTLKETKYQAEFRKLAILTPKPESVPSCGESEKIEIPDWILKYDKANYQSGAGKAVRELVNIIKKLQP